MIGKIFILIVVTLFVLAGCSKYEAKYSSSSHTVELVPWDEIEIITTGDTTVYVVDNMHYRYLINVDGRTRNAVHDSYYVVLTNDPEVTFIEVDRVFWESTLPFIRSFHIIEWGLVDNMFD